MQTFDHTASDKEPATRAASSPKNWRFWQWALAAVFISCVIVCVVAYRIIHVSPEVTHVRDIVARSAIIRSTVVQLSAGREVFSLARCALWFGPEDTPAQAKEALKALRGASVGVYQLSEADRVLMGTDFFAKLDREMTGWSRVVRVIDHDDWVMIYAQPNPDDHRVKVCVLVVDECDLVIVTAEADTDGLSRIVSESMEMAMEHAGGGRIRI